MLFNTFAFIFGFLPLVYFTTFFVRKSNDLFKIVLCGASLFFYAVWEAKYLPLLVGSITLNFLMAKKIVLLLDKNNENHAKKTLYISILFNLLLLGIFKYTGFFLKVIEDIAGGSFSVEITLPLAISFFTFQQMAFLVDVYKKNTKPDNFLNYFFFVSFFPQLIAGPIVNYKNIRPQLSSICLFDKKNLMYGLHYLILGLFKKTVIADSLAGNANSIFKAEATLDALSSWIGTLSYTFQIYFDFSGYTDIAFGLALFFGIKLPTNFNSPYKSKNIQDFWRRWHITLSSWFKEYLYIPMGGNQLGKGRTLLNIFFIALVSGLWHGAGYGFLLWGLLHGVALVVHRVFSSSLKVKTQFKAISFVGKTLSIGMTFLFIHLTWIFFRAENFEIAKNVFVSLFSSYDGEIPPFSLFKIVSLSILGIVCFFAPNSNLLCERDYPVWFSFFIGFVLFLSIGFMNRVSEFVYFQF